MWISMTKQWLIYENVVHLMANHVIYFILKNIKNWVCSKDPGPCILSGTCGARGTDLQFADDETCALNN